MTFPTHSCLPDDDPQGEWMILMCRLAHHTVTEVHEIKPKDLEGLILVCDKYGCAASFKFHLHTIMANWLADHKRALSEENTTTTYAGLHILDALCMAYLTQDAECFNELRPVRVRQGNHQLD